MKITKIILKKHKLLSLRNIEELVFEPQSKFQLVLGTNGSGKSTLLREYSPLAAIPAQYYRGGMKIVEGTDKGNRYILKSDFSGPKNIFSFIEISPQGIETELNPGHTGNVYNNMVWQKFGIDKEIQDIRIGKRKFTELSPSDRKSWISRISHADYTYALVYYQKLLSHYRDTLGSIKTDQNRLLEAVGKVVTKDQETSQRSLLTLIKKEIDHLNNLRPNPSMSHQQVIEGINSFNRLSHERLKEFRKVLCSSRHLLPLGNSDEIEIELRSLEIEQSKHNDRVDVLFDRSNEISNILKQHGKTMGLDEEEVHSKINSLQNKVSSIEDSFEFPLTDILDRADVSEALFSYTTWNTKITDIISNMVSDTNGEYSVLSQNQTYSELQECFGKKNALEVSMGKFENEIQKQLECSKEEHTQCPNCKHTWHPGFSKIVLNDLREKLSAQKEIHTKVVSVIDTLQETLTKQRKHYAGLQMYTQLENSSPLFKSFYAFANKDECVVKSPEFLTQLVFQYGNELQAYSNLLVPLAELDELRRIASSKLFERTENLKKFEEELTTNTKEVAKIYDAIDGLSKKILFLRKKKSLKNLIFVTKEQSNKTIEEIKKLSVVYGEHETRSFVGDMILERSHQLINLEKSLKEIDLKNHHVNMLEKQIQDAQDYAKTLKIAVDTLSPREGLIAYGLTGFINHFLKIVNSVISKYCLYTMEIQAFVPDEEGIDLDYKFKIMIGSEIVDDISNCSEGQKELINLAIVISSLVMLGLDHGDLFLDEFGVKLDPAHRASSHKAIEELLANSNFSRVLMVSHFDESFNMNLESDVSVICDANLHLPSDLVYNKHMTIK